MGKLLFGMLIAIGLCAAQMPPESGQPPGTERSEYVVEQPGTITFKTGVVIVGKVEKPQVIIFLPKEKSYYREFSFSRSFADDIGEALEFDPIIE